MSEKYTIKNTTEMFIDEIKNSRSALTKKTYMNALTAFVEMLSDKNISSNSSVSKLSESLFDDFAKHLKSYAHATRGLYINVVKNYYEFLIAKKIREFNFFEIKYIIKNNTQKKGIRLLHFPETDIERVIKYALNGIPNGTLTYDYDKLINLRDSAFLITLADTGLRVHEACNLKINDIDFVSNKAIIIGKGDKQAVIRFSDRSINAIKNYLEARKKQLNNNNELSIAQLPVFARHDRGVGNKSEPITTKTGRLIVSQRVKECLGDNYEGKITPHSFRHYFVTNVLRKTGNIKIAQEFARHSSVTVTERYAHLADVELDKNYDKIFNVV